MNSQLEARSSATVAFANVGPRTRVAPSSVNGRGRHGLTLLELMVVLIILAIVATVAMRSLEPQINNQRIRSATRLLDEIRTATIGPVQKYQLDGTPLTSGFVADVGCLPIAPPESDDSSQSGSEFVLAELWDATQGLAVNYPFQYRSGPNKPSNYSDIRLPCGWRGPYLQLAAGANTLVGPWGEPPKLMPLPDGQVGEVLIEIPEGADIELEDPFRVSLAAGKVMVTGRVLLDNPDNANVTVALLTPDPSSSLTTLAVLDDEDNQRETFLFRQVPIGYRAIVADANGRRQVKYVEIPHRGLNVVFDFRQTGN